MSAAPPLYVIGDVHGQYEKLVRLLRREGLIDDADRWAAGTATVWFIGDLVDRGPDGIGVVDLVMRLQDEAPSAGGRVGCLLGNHELMLLAAYRFGDSRASGPGGTFALAWMMNGGRSDDLARMAPQHAHWITSLPAMALEGEALLLHADAMFYTRYGRSVDEVNATISQMLRRENPREWDELSGQFAERHAFERRARRTARFVRSYGARMLVHGHTPISVVRKVSARDVTGPHIYADGMCVNVDGGMYAGGPGFVCHIAQ